MNENIQKILFYFFLIMSIAGNWDQYKAQGNFLLGTNWNYIGPKQTLCQAPRGIIFSPRKLFLNSNWNYTRPEETSLSSDRDLHQAPCYAPNRIRWGPQQRFAKFQLGPYWRQGNFFLSSNWDYIGLKQSFVLCRRKHLARRQLGLY